MTTAPPKAVVVVVEMATAVAVVDGGRKHPVATAAAMVAVVAITRPAHKAHAVPRAMAAAAKAVVVDNNMHPAATHSRAAMKADLAAAWVRAVPPVVAKAASPTRCAPVSI